MKRTLVISAINLFSGGTLTIAYNCLDSLVESKMYKDYNIIIIVHKIELYSKYVEYFKFIEFPDSRKSWFRRLYYEFYYFKKLSRELKPYLWFSLHDITSSVQAEKRVVYCHNSTPFYKISKKDLKYDKVVVAFALFYKYLYRINIHKNNYVVVQQNWLKESFAKIFRLNKNKIIVASPFPEQKNIQSTTNQEGKEIRNFFYPSLSRQFKNFETVCEAAKILKTRGVENFSVKITIDGTENRYTKDIYNNYKDIDSIEFSALIPFEKMSEEYAKADCLIFASRLESWGLPISEFASYGKPMLLADLPYAHETSEGSMKTSFFNPTSPIELADKMERLIGGNTSFLSPIAKKKNNILVATSWYDLFNIILKE